MTWIVLALALAMLIGMALLLLSSPGRRRGEGESYQTVERQYMPPEIAAGTLVLSETTIRVRVPAMIVAKPDQVYLTSDGWLVPVENKTRPIDAVYDYDRAEVSVQGFALRHGRTGNLKKYPVASYGYIRVKRPNAPPVYHRVSLHTDDAIVAMRQRRLDIEAGRVEPGGPASSRLCPKCSKRDTCPRVQAAAIRN